MAPAPADRTYSDSHEWHKLDGDTLTLGLTQFAVDQLTDVTYAELKPAGTKVATGGAVGEVESVKTTSDIYSAAAGEIVEVNMAVVDDPSSTPIPTARAGSSKSKSPTSPASPSSWTRRRTPSNIRDPLLHIPPDSSPQCPRPRRQRTQRIAR